MSTPCKECGYPLESGDTFCPECGCPVEKPVYTETPNPYASQAVPPAAPTQTYSVGNGNVAPVYVAPAPKTDWAQYFYDCAVIGWEALKKYCTFTGRSSRREYWSFYMLMLMCALPYGVGLLIFLLPWIGVSIRRMHDTGHSGWWICCPFVGFFLLFKRSDEGPNYYGNPNPATNLL